MSTLARFVDVHREEILLAWEREVAARHLLPTCSTPQLLNDMPRFIGDLVSGLSEPAEEVSFASAQSHASQRLELGIDIESLAQEFDMLGETILDLLSAHRVQPPLEEIKHLWRLISYGTSSSVARFAELKNQQLRQQASQGYAFIAHELRTPLMTARLCTDLLYERMPRDAGLEEAFCRLRRAHHQLSELIDNSLVQVRLAEEQVPAFQSVELAGLIEDVVQQMRPLAHSNGVSINLELDREFRADLDPKLIESAIANLLTNAIKFSAAGSAVEVHGRRSSDRALIEIIDSCGGMPPELPNQLFRAHVQGIGEHSGFGLGLAIVKEVMDLHHGTVTVQEVPGRGCRFTLELATEVDDSVEPSRGAGTA